MISIHPLRSERDELNLVGPEIFEISIRSPQVKEDVDIAGYNEGVALFQSTPSEWKETSSRATRFGTRQNFNPLPPEWRETLSK